ncbi:MAG: hotdog domain-containing protein [Elusimicrobiota bacterium]
MNGKFHENCFACGKHALNGLKLEFKLLQNSAVSGGCAISTDYQGYDNIVHGGVVSAILDSSMVNLFYLRDGLELKTAKLNVRFIKPVPVTEKLTIHAVADNNARHFHKAKSQIKINNTVYAEAEGYFRK